MKGFTLLELTIVLMVVCILAAIAVPYVHEQTREDRVDTYHENYHSDCQ